MATEHPSTPQRSWRALALLLSYPQPEMVDLAAVVLSTLREEGRLSPETLRRVGSLTQQLQQDPLLSCQERYVALFDRGRKLSLNLFEHVYGEAKGRGAAMAALSEIYAESGLSVAGGELPDFLPTLCEFVAVAPGPRATGLLKDALPVIQSLQERVSARDTGYGGVVAGIIEMLGQLPSRERPKANEVRELTLAELDEAWAEKAVTFDAGAAHDSREAMPAEAPPVGLRAGPKGRRLDGGSGPSKGGLES